MTSSDAELVDRIRSGDSAAFEVLMRRHFRMAFLIAFAQLGSRTEAEDACQDAFFRCWERIGDCREPARVAAWIGTTVRNTASNRREWLRIRETMPIDRAGEVASTSRADAATERAELQARLSSAMQQLSPIQREVMLLHDIEGYQHAEVAERLGLSETMSRRHLSDARLTLRRLLATVRSMVNHD